MSSRGFLAWIGAQTIDQIETLRLVGGLYRQMAARLATRPIRWAEVAHHISHSGIGSLPVVSVSTGFAGLVITGEIAWHMNQALHTIDMVPGFTGQFIFRELGVAIPAMLYVSKVGASTTAEIGTMKITEQIDALKLLGIDEVDYLVIPRWIASIVSMFILTAFSIFVCLLCALAVATGQLNFNALEYLNSLRQFVDGTDVMVAVVKGVTFGAIIPVVSCAYGLRCRGGAEGVGTATTQAVVTSTVIVILFDFVLTFLFS